MQGGLDFADMCEGAAFESYQRNDTKYLAILRAYVVIKDLTNTVPAEKLAAIEMTLSAGSFFYQSPNGGSSVA
jgi:hypothetical protein